MVTLACVSIQILSDYINESKPNISLIIELHILYKLYKKKSTSKNVYTLQLNCFFFQLIKSKNVILCRISTNDVISFNNINN